MLLPPAQVNSFYLERDKQLSHQLTLQFVNCFWVNSREIKSVDDVRVVDLGAWWYRLRLGCKVAGAKVITVSLIKIIGKMLFEMLILEKRNIWFVNSLIFQLHWSWFPSFRCTLLQSKALTSTTWTLIGILMA